MISKIDANLALCNPESMVKVPENLFMNQIGFHLSSGTESIIERFDMYKKWSNVFQFFSCNPLPQYWFHGDRGEHQRRLSDFNSVLSVSNSVLHGPYWTNLTDNSKYTFNVSLGFVRSHFEFFKRNPQNNILKLVIHPSTNSNPDLSKRSLIHFLNEFVYMCEKYHSVSLQLCIENEPNAKSYSNAFYLLDVIKQFNHPNIKLCLDTCHAFVSGVKFSEFEFSDLIDYLGVIHLNSAPEEATFASGLDRHSFIALNEGRPEIFQEYKPLLISILNNLSIPVILERRDLNVVYRDLSFLSSELGNKEC